MTVIALLLNYKADIKAVSGDGKNALDSVCDNRHQDVFEFVVDQGFDASRIVSPVLHYAASHNYLKGCEKLLKLGAMVDRKVNCAYGRGVTPMMCCLYGQSAKVDFVEIGPIELLLEYGADISMKDDEGSNAFKKATSVAWHSERAAEAIIKVLMRHIAQLECLNLSIDEGDKQIIQSSDDYSKYYETCLQEFEATKGARFYDDVTVFSILMGDEKMVSGFARNEELVKAFEETVCDDQFPIYSALLKKRFSAPVKKGKLRNNAAIILSDLFIFNDSRRPVNECILGFFSDKDLEYLCSHFDSTSV